MEDQIRNEIDYLQEQFYRAHDRHTQRALFDESERLRNILMDQTGEYEEIQATGDESTYMSTFGDGSAFVNGVYDGRYNQRQCNCPRCTGLVSAPITINSSDLAVLQQINSIFTGLVGSGEEQESDGDLD